MLGDRRPHLGAQRLLVRHDAGAGQSGGGVAGKARELPHPHGHPAHRALEGDTVDGHPRHAAVQEPGHRHQQAGGPGVPVQTEAGHHVGAGLPSVVAQHLRGVPGQEGVQGVAARRELVRADPAAAARELLALAGLMHAQAGKTADSRAYEAATGDVKGRAAVR